MSAAEWTAIIVAAGALLAALGNWVKQRADVKIDTARIYGELSDDLQAEIKRLEDKITRLETRAEQQQEQILKLRLELEQARGRITALESENERLQAENARLRGEHNNARIINTNE